MSTATKTWRLGGAAGYSVHAVGTETRGVPYTRVELWKDAEGEADVLCSLPLDAKRKDILVAFRTWLPVSMSADDVKFLCGLVRTAYAQRAI